MERNFKETVSLYCSCCNTDVTVHADGSACCGCDSRGIADGKSLPPSWEGERQEFRAYMRYVSKL